ncbi:IS4 family transposase [Mucilaginibacter galii]|uniref:IS4 family transposase n=4 Tax=Mucilaginibacter galii TaxID=2005073 RepID=UPI0036435EFE
MQNADYRDRFGDKRIERRGEELHKRLFRSGRSSIQSLSLTRAEQKAYYRLLHHEKVSERKLVDELSDRCSASVKGKLVLAIQDTTEIDLGRHYNRINKSSGIGTLDGGFERHIGFKVHPSLVLDACTGFPLGYSEIRVWERPFEQPLKRERNYQQQSIEEKESYKWFDTSNRTKLCLKQAEAVIIIQDREGDIFEQFVTVADEKTYLLVRSRVNRKLDNAGKLWDELDRSTLLGSYMIQIDADSRSKEPARQAEIEVRSIKASVCSPSKNSPPLTLYAVEAREVNSSAKEPVLWRLLTNWSVESYDQAKLIIEWYGCRWVIEEVFRSLKKGGFNIEQSEIESGWAIRKLCIMLLDTVLKIMQMQIAYHMPEGCDPGITICFDHEQQECLAVMNKKAEGKTQALRNPFNPRELRWATWVIARNGGWKGYRSQQPPGMTTIWRGLQRFYDVLDGWNLFKDIGTP